MPAPQCDGFGLLDRLAFKAFEHSGQSRLHVAGNPDETGPELLVPNAEHYAYRLFVLADGITVSRVPADGRGRRRRR
jgi:hypothetical protein